MQTPAGWYPDPESPSQQRYWDGTQWTEHRAPAAPPANAPAPAAPAAPAPAAPVWTPPSAPVAPPGAAPGMAPPAAAPAAMSGGPMTADAPAKRSRVALWVILGVVALIAIVIALVVALSDSASESLESILPTPLEENFARQGVPVEITKVDCGDVELEDGPFEVDCTVTLAGSSRTLATMVTGTIDGSTIRVTDASSEANLVNEDAAISAVQGLVDRVADDVEVLTCELPEPLLVLRKGDTFTCETDSDETLEITATSTSSVEITKVR